MTKPVLSAVVTRTAVLPPAPVDGAISGMASGIGAVAGTDSMGRRYDC